MRFHRHVDTTDLDAAGVPVGPWLSADGTVRLDIKTDGTYVGKVLGRKRPARGTYHLEDGVLTLDDDSGLHTPVTVRGDALEMAGHRLGRVAL
ncbi:hypothetical protein KOI35_29175 [Actinoplanes bogorensis]|uniref:Ligand-binding protein with streptavidin-like fold n=1 Tax=Paractinoplanes bogorensis TaxID=1610840 RepID=A0ABS5YY20_9ACTN|nr:Atu4866 domain-containing protein [Actinoplanes bogorensis]MBU2667593.1 hypothetical protein [Actinoplanes bogorensis]